ncbi:hypothetical protein LTS18_004469 [Coniosporium uncinatum]|uniref:Uncharacterized protein n=1 Tax=Coniosporium uncinatum TaxID=93489 RepID=A0ACC3DB66_9PEZI|nr:hypothetical protein LTS18_004469 [Coniosporium uncinatum]
MKSFAVAAAAATFAGIVSAKQCQNITVPVTISARNGLFDQSALTPVTNIDVTNFILNLVQQGENYTANVLQGYQTVSGTYDLATTYCAPDSGAPNVVQLLTHGIGFDRSYWDLPFNNYNYSYVNEAVDEYGFATFSWDRLGIGMSEHGEPVNEIQAWLEVAALKALTDKLRAGSIGGVPQFSKVVHVGHSFGSEHTYAMTAMYPGSSDGIALTGFSQNGTFIPYFALGGNFIQANKVSSLSNYVNGYLAAGDPSAVQTNFFAPGAFDPAILTVATQTGQPVTIGELLTIGGETGTPNHFAGPVLIITGNRDLPYCGGNCAAGPTGYPNIPSTSKNNFLNASAFEVVIVPGAGHGLNLEYSHPFTYGTINNFFVQQGNGPAGATTQSVTPIPSATSAAGASQASSAPSGASSSAAAGASSAAGGVSSAAGGASSATGGASSAAGGASSAAGGAPSSTAAGAPTSGAAGSAKPSAPAYPSKGQGHGWGNGWPHTAAHGGW